MPWFKVMGKAVSVVLNPVAYGIRDYTDKYAVEDKSSTHEGQAACK